VAVYDRQQRQARFVERVTATTEEAP
jgi:hypothetical protein